MGRAARNIQGTAIFYANRVTQSMQKCMDATNSRRQRQLEYNRKNGVEMKSTKGSSMLSIFDLLKDQIAEEQPLEVIGRKVGSRKRLSVSDGVDATVHVAETIGAEVTLDHLPSKPGCYMWVGPDEKILYIGKAKRLRSRVRSYLAPGAKHTKRIQVMLQKAARVDIVLTGSDRDALLLESNMIKHHQPPYNVLLKDDESYPYICASLGDTFPRFYVVPRRHEGSPSTRDYRYFGPYPHYKEINAVLEGIEAKYDLRAKSFMARHDSAQISRADYNRLFQQALDENFSATGSESPTGLAEMRSKFEEGGLLFDSDTNCSRDVVALSPVPGPEEESSALVQVVQFRDGLVAGQFSYHVEVPTGINTDEDRAAAIQHVLERRHYPSGEESVTVAFSFFPKEIIVQHMCEDTKDLKLAIRSSRRKLSTGKLDKLVLRSAAKRGKNKEADRRALELVLENAKQAAFERSLETVRSATKTSVDGTALKELAKVLGLEKEPTRIECYDVSHNQGDFPVASRVVFVGGRPVPQLYRKFNIRSVEGPDDYASLEETLSRRFKRAWVNGEGGPVGEDDPWSLPDVVLIDGGLGQLNAAAKGMAKARVFPADGKDQVSPTVGEKRGATVAICSLAKNHEELFVYGTKGPVNDAPDSPALLLLRALRDESHRFALKSHRSRRSIKNQS